jgi:hypothetical protein
LTGAGIRHRLSTSASVKQLIGSGESARDQRVEALTEHTLQIGRERAGRRLLGCAIGYEASIPSLSLPGRSDGESGLQRRK